jgi:hypothetical protein
MTKGAAMVKLQLPVPEAHPPCADVMAVATGAPAAVTSVSEIMYPVAKGTAEKTNGLLVPTTPVGLTAVGAVAGMVAAGITAVCVVENPEALTSLTART